MKMENIQMAIPPLPKKRIKETNMCECLRTCVRHVHVFPKIVEVCYMDVSLLHRFYVSLYVGIFGAFRSVARLGSIPPSEEENSGHKPV